MNSAFMHDSQKTSQQLWLKKKKKKKRKHRRSTFKCYPNIHKREPACVFLKDLPFSVKKGLLIRTHVFFKVDETGRFIDDIQKEPACVYMKSLVLKSFNPYHTSSRLMKLAG